MLHNETVCAAPRPCIDDALCELFEHQQRSLDLIEGMELRLEGPHPMADAPKLDFGSMGIMDKLSVLLDRSRNIVNRTERIRAQL